MRIPANSTQQTWTQGTFRRDTLVHSLSRLAEGVLRAAFEDQRFREQYELWRLDCSEATTGGSQVSAPLLFTGMNQGELAILARNQEDEFFIKLNHPEFSALIAIAYERHAERSAATWISQFEGELLEGIHFATELTDQIHMRRQRNSGVPTPMAEACALN